jgi:hypothetical protein
MRIVEGWRRAPHARERPDRDTVLLSKSSATTTVTPDSAGARSPAHRPKLVTNWPKRSRRPLDCSPAHDAFDRTSKSVHTHRLVHPRPWQSLPLAAAHSRSTPGQSASALRHIFGWASHANTPAVAGPRTAANQRLDNSSQKKSLRTYKDTLRRASPRAKLRRQES